MAAMAASTALATALGAGCSSGALRNEPIGKTSAALTSGPWVWTRAYDNQRSGSNTQETLLTQANVRHSYFGRQFQLPVDDRVYAQVLYAPAENTSQGPKNLALVATGNNSVYAFDADSGALVWGGPPTNNYGTPPNGSDIMCSDLNGSSAPPGNAGIMSTPVIDTSSNVMYFVTHTIDTTKTVYSYYLHALDIVTGHNRPDLGSPVFIQASVMGTGSGNVNGTISLDPRLNSQRAALGLDSTAVYIGFASYCDNPMNGYHGWLLAYNKTNLQQQPAAFNTTRNGTQGGIWQGGGGPAFNVDFA
jgi:hypothetical protein